MEAEKLREFSQYSSVIGLPSFFDCAEFPVPPPPVAEETLAQDDSSVEEPEEPD